MACSSDQLPFDLILVSVFIPIHFYDMNLILANIATEAELLDGTVVYSLSRLDRFEDQRLLWVGLAAFCILAVTFVFWFYRRESVVLQGGMKWILPILRVLALTGLVAFFLAPEKRVDQTEVKDSVVVLLVDTSLSMSVEDEINGDGEKESRIQSVSDLIIGSSLVQELRMHHQVVLAVFDKEKDNLYRWQRASLEMDEKRGGPDSKDKQGWLESLTPRGSETRIGDALLAVLDEETNNPLAGIIIFSDGGQNRGLKPLTVADQIRERSATVHVVGLGSTSPRRNLRVQQFNAPSRVHPEDRTAVSGVIKGEGFAGKSISVELLAKDADANSVPELVGQTQVQFVDDDEEVSVKFDIEPAEIGRLILELKVVAPEQDQYGADNHREVEMEVVERKAKVLLIASGAMRDYRFLRNQLRRDRFTEVDVWLQSALPGVSQDADRILTSFPDSKEALYPYDCIVAFDPNWGLLDVAQVELLESWVAEQAGGLIVVAGPVHTSSWVQIPEYAKIRSLYPVRFQKRLTWLDDGLFGSKTPWPIIFSRDGRESNYLWLGDTVEDNEEAWAEFSGVFGCYAVKGPKPGARVLGRYSDPEAGISTERPVYLAEHFYGSGRVFYMGSGELWRLRSLDVGYFEVLYTRLIRHVSQGRILRGSSQGQLLLQRDRYTVGDDVVVRAQLVSSSLEPLSDESVTAIVVGPEEQAESVVLRSDRERPGNYLGQFAAYKEGSYRIELAVADAEGDKLVKRIQVTAPDLEFDETRRAEDVLKAIASRSGGLYYPQLSNLVEGDGQLPPVLELLPSRAESTIKKGKPDQLFNEKLNRWLLGIICGALSIEWFLRRLLRLA